MSLRRVTLSGRFVQNENKDESTIMVIMKGLFFVTLDIGIALAVSFYALRMFLGNLIFPFERGFYCYEVKLIR